MRDIPSPGEIPRERKIPLSRTDTEFDVREKGIKIEPNRCRFSIYYVKCDLYGGPSFDDVKREARSFLNHSGESLPDWLYPAFLADDVYYIGQTSNLGLRLQAHHCHMRKGDGEPDEPSILTAISRTTEAGVIATRRTRGLARGCETHAHAAWITDDDTRFVYSA